MRSFVVSLFLAAALAAPAPKFRVEWDESTGRPVERLGSADEAACGFSCLHGAVMDSGSCTCICPKDKFWVGKVCDKCSLRDEDCLHGRLDRASCKCTECAAPWKGEFCDECGLDSSTCAHNGDMDPVTCACRNCDAPWGGKTCSDCLRSPDLCVAPDPSQSGKLDLETCSCHGCDGGSSGSRFFCGAQCPLKCERFSVKDGASCVCAGCPAYYNGPKCDTCAVKQEECRHSSTADSKTCSCEATCADGWKGRFCEVCDRTEAVCVNGGRLSKATCRCHACDFPYEGDFCDKCSLQESDCLHGSHLCPKSCKCSGCKRPWTGRRCERCALRKEECLHGGVLDPDPSSCKCKCTVGWGGATCDTCVLSAEICGEGTRVDLRRCQCIRTGAGGGALGSPRRTGGGALAASAPVGGGMRFKRTSVTLTAGTASSSAASSAVSWRAMGGATTGRAPAGTLITCRFSGIADQVVNYVGTKTYYGRRRDGYYQHLFSPQECTGGRVPNPLKGQWFSSLVSYYHCGEAEQWSVLAPDDVDGPGVMWYNSNPCGANGGPQGLADIKAQFFLPSSEQAKHLHRCTFEGQPGRILRKGNCTGRMGSAEAFKDFKGFNGANGQLESDRFMGDLMQDSTGAVATEGYFEHAFTNDECMNDRPPLDADDKPKCLVSWRWGEHCGGDHDWAATASGKDGARMSWYTSHKCTSARVAADYYCPTTGDFSLRLHRCTFKGAGTETAECRDNARARHANDPPKGKCFAHAFKADECTNGLPGADLDSGGGASCVASFRQVAQCGEEQDFAANVGNGSLSVTWYNAKPCGDASIGVDVYCHGACVRECKNGGKLDLKTCRCECPFPFTGTTCDVCGLEQADCAHEGKLDAVQCKCNSCASPWSGRLCDKCPRSKDSCLHGGRFHAGSCRCLDCADGWVGDLCERCNRDPNKCMRGSTLSMSTCRCETNCPAPFWGIYCDRCPRGASGKECSGHGNCATSPSGGVCVCLGDWSGAACELKKETAVCDLYGLGYVETLDDAKYTMEGRGEYTAYDMIGSSDQIRESVHVIMSSIGLQSKTAVASSVSAVAIRRGKDTIAVVGRKPSDKSTFASDVYVNCARVSARDPQVIDGSLALHFTGNGYQIQSVSDLRVDVTVSHLNGSDFKSRQFLETIVRAREPATGNARGLCGNLDKVKENDFAPFPATAAGAQAFSARYVVPSGKSLFGCASSGNPVDVPAYAAVEVDSSASGGGRQRRQRLRSRRKQRLPGLADGHRSGRRRLVPNTMMVPKEPSIPLPGTPMTDNCNNHNLATGIPGRQDDMVKPFTGGCGGGTGAVSIDERVGEWPAPPPYIGGPHAKDRKSGHRRAHAVSDDSLLLQVGSKAPKASSTEAAPAAKSPNTPPAQATTQAVYATEALGDIAKLAVATEGGETAQGECSCPAKDFLAAAKTCCDKLDLPKAGADAAYCSCVRTYCLLPGVDDACTNAMAPTMRMQHRRTEVIDTDKRDAARRANDEKLAAENADKAAKAEAAKFANALGGEAEPEEC